MKLSQLTTIILLTLTSCKQTTGDSQDKTNHLQFEKYSNKYKSLLVTAKELMQDSFYNARNYENYESLEIDTASSSILYVKYRFKVKDTKTNFNLTIGTLISIEKSEEAAQNTLSTWQSGYDMGFNNSPIKQQEFEIKSFDSILARSVTSKFIEYIQEGNLIGYSLTGRTKHISYLYTVSSNHIQHLNYLYLLQQKSDALTKLEDSTNKKKGL